MAVNPWIVGGFSFGFVAIVVIVVAVHFLRKRSGNTASSLASSFLSSDYADFVRVDKQRTTDMSKVRELTTYQITSNGLFHLAVRNGDDGNPKEYLAFLNTDFCNSTYDRQRTAATSSTVIGDTVNAETTSTKGPGWDSATALACRLGLGHSDPPANWSQISDLKTFATSQEAVVALKKVLPDYPLQIVPSFKGVNVVGQVKKDYPVMYVFYVPEATDNSRSTTGYMNIGPDPPAA
eukprot:jgi/Mesvir1/1514/Mv14497-RA.1